MLVEDKTKYCWCIDEVAGEPQNSIKDAILDYVDNEYNYGDYGSLSREKLLQTTIEIGHPYYYAPEVDGERVIYDLLDNDLPEEFAECDFVYFKKVKQEHLCKLSKELTEVFRKWEKSHGYGYRYGYKAYLVQETERYRIGDYIDKQGCGL